MILSECPDIIFLLETLGPCMAVEHTLYTLFKGCIFHVISVQGHSRSGSLGYNSKTVKLSNI